MKKAVFPALITLVLAAVLLAVPSVADQYGRPDVYGSEAYPQKYGRTGSDINVNTLSDSLSVELSADTTSLSDSDGVITFSLKASGGSDDITVTAMCVIPAYDTGIFAAVATGNALSEDSFLNDRIGFESLSVIKDSGWTKQMQAYTVTAVWDPAEPAVIPAGETVDFYSFALSPKVREGSTDVYVYVTLKNGSLEYSRLLSLEIGENGEEETAVPAETPTEIPMETPEPTLYEETTETPSPTPAPTAVPTEKPSDDTPAPTSAPPVETPVPENKPIKSVAVSIGDTLALRIKTVIPAGVREASMKFTFGYDVKTVKGETDGSGYTWFVLRGIGFQDMTRDIGFELILDGKTADSRSGFSIKEYAVRLHEKYPEDGRLTLLLGRMLMFGAESQRMMTHSALELPTDNVEFVKDRSLFGDTERPEADKALVTAGDERYGIMHWGFNNPSYLSYGLKVKNQGGYTCSFEDLEGYENAKVISMTDETGTSIALPRLSIVNIDKTCFFDNGGGNTLKCSGLSYIAENWDSELRDYVRSLYAFYLAAVNYVK